MFIVKTDLFAGFDRYTLLNQQTGEYLTVLPENGGLLQELVLLKNNQLHSLIDGVTAAELPDNAWFKSAILFPFPSRIRNGTYEFEGNSYQLPINEPSRQTALHGFAFGKKFTVTNTLAETDFALLEMTYQYEGEVSGYPFPGVLKVTYRLDAGQPSQPGTLTCEFSVTNTGNRNMPMGVGWHPYFKTGSAVDALLLDLPNTLHHEFDEQMIPTGKQRKLKTAKNGTLSLHQMELDHSFQTRKNYRVTLYDTHKDLKININSRKFGNQGTFYWQVFTPSHRQSIALEPQTCPANAFNTQVGLIVLPPSQTWTGSLTVSLA